ncbi:MAG TPA: restriction endonuclease subunit S [Bacteroidales bacterium]|nr:restriction endonuclease subunit S [Bacteroidales bacterium]
MKFEKLGNIADIIAGQSPPSSTYNSEGKGIPFFQGKADYGEKYPTVRYWCTEPTKISLPDDILISMRAPVGPVNINIVESCIGRGLSAIRVKKNVSRDFIYFWLKQNQHIIAAKETGSTFKAITQKILNEIIVPFPSYPDQLHIANILSKAENLIAQRKESIRLLDEFLKSTFLEMFGDPVRNEKGWEIKQLGMVTHMKAGQFVAASDIQTESNEGFYSCYGGNGIRGYVKSYTHEGDFVLIGRQGALCGNVKIAKGQFHATEHAVVCSPKLKFETYWLYFLLDVFNLNKFASGAAQPGLAVGRLEQIDIFFPPITLQTQFAQIVEKTEALKTLYQQSLTELENLYGSLSQKAFKGELSIKNHANL